jgi:choline dehydrogenase-like flavoprotein
VSCTREVILAAGAVHTPQLLELSGIGPAEVVRAHSIPQVLDLPGVGNNFQDHPLVGVFYYGKCCFESVNHLPFTDVSSFQCKLFDDNHDRE